MGNSTTMNMNCTVEYWGILADRRGTRQERISTNAQDVKQLYDELFVSHNDALSAVVKPVINDAFVSWQHNLTDGDQVAFLPPMSGG